jgi:small subunit ribosomal protein S19e
MTTVREVDQGKLVDRVAKDIEKKIPMPDWARFVKTGQSRERPPEQANWWWLRAASILRKVYLDGPVGVQRLRTYYGGRKNLGHQPEHFKRGGGKIIRVVLQELERARLIETVSKPCKGRAVTREGQKLMDNAARAISV